MDEKQNIPLFDDPNRYARTAALELIVHGYQEYSITKNTIVPSPVDVPLNRKQELIKRYFRADFIKNKSLLDIGANGGFFDFWAEQSGAGRITALDIDEKYLENISKVKAFWNFENVRTVKANVQDWEEPADIVLAFAMIHWLYSCTSSYGSLDAVIKKLADLTNNLLVVEWIAPEDPAIQFFKHTEFNSSIVSGPYNLDSFESALLKYFSKVEILADINSSRVVYVAFKTVREITQFDELPLLAPKENIISSQSLGMIGENKILSCLYRTDKSILKQTTGTFVLHEAEILQLFDATYFPKIIGTVQEENYSVAEMEWIDGKPLAESLNEIARTPLIFKNFLDECLNILALLQEAGVKHRDIIIENILVRNGLPVLIDFGWAEKLDEPYITPEGLGNEGRVPDGPYCDVYAMGKLFERIIPKGVKYFHPLKKNMAEKETIKRNTNINQLKSILKGIEVPENWDEKPKFKIYSWRWAYTPIEIEKFICGEGFYGEENGERWMSAKGVLMVKPTSEPVLLNFVLTCNAMPHYRQTSFAVSLCDGEEVVDQIIFTKDSEEKLISLKIPESESNTIVTLVSDAFFVPAEINLNEDTRILSVRLSGIEVVPDVLSEELWDEKDMNDGEEVINDLTEQGIEDQQAVNSDNRDLHFPTNNEKRINLTASLLRQADVLFNNGNHSEAESLLKKTLAYAGTNLTTKNVELFEQFENKKFLYNYKPNVDEYEEWISINELSREEVEKIYLTIENFIYKPLVSIVTPVYNVNPKWLRLCVDSVLSQFYPNWELCLVDDGSTRKETLQMLKEIEKLDPRIVVNYQKENGGISSASNIALTMAKGEFIALLDNDDELTPDALYEVVKLLNDKKETDFIYTDEDKLDITGKRCEPFFKPDWSQELIRSYAYTCHLTVFRKSLMEEVGGFRNKFSGAQDYDITLRITERTKNIGHISKVLYHWRKIPGSAADVVNAKSWALSASKLVLDEHIERCNFDAQVFEAENAPGCYRVRYSIKNKPLVSILLPTRGQLSGKPEDELLFKCIQSVARKTEYDNYELLICYNNSLDSKIAKFLKSYQHRAITYDLKGDFNFANKINYMAKQAKGEHLVIFNDDLEVISGEWLTALLEFSQQEEIGVVGSKLLYPNGRLQHVGMVLGINGYPAHIFHQAVAGHPGYRADANLIRNYSVVTGAGMMIKKEIFEKLNGLNENFRIDYNDTDFCLRVAEQGYRNVYTPYSLFYHHESTVLSSGRLKDIETDLFRTRWGGVLDNDPFYNKNLTRKKLDCSLDICPV
jgi:O-antigen biosynthesis protein